MMGKTGIPWPFAFSPILCGTTTAMVQTFYAYRLFGLSHRRKMIPMLILFGTLLQFSWSTATQWQVVDQILYDLRQETRRYRYAYHILILEDDGARFPGNRRFSELGNPGGVLPTRERVEAVMAELEARFPSEPTVDEETY